jgi:hypothetical protein
MSDRPQWSVIQHAAELYADLAEREGSQADRAAAASLLVEDARVQELREAAQQLYEMRTIQAEERTRKALKAWEGE